MHWYLGFLVALELSIPEQSLKELFSLSLFPSLFSGLCRADTVMIVCVGAGVLVGSAINYQWEYIHPSPYPPPYSIVWPTFDMVGLSLLRMAIGLMILLATKATVKWLSLAILEAIFVRKTFSPSLCLQDVAIECIYKFFTYLLIAINTLFLCPAVFIILNIERPLWYTEV